MLGVRLSAVERMRWHICKAHRTSQVDTVGIRPMHAWCKTDIVESGKEKRVALPLVCLDNVWSCSFGIVQSVCYLQCFRACNTLYEYVYMCAAFMYVCNGICNYKCIYFGFKVNSHRGEYHHVSSLSRHTHTHIHTTHLVDDESLLNLHSHHSHDPFMLNEEPAAVFYRRNGCVMYMWPTEPL